MQPSIGLIDALSGGAPLSALVAVAAFGVILVFLASRGR